MINISIRLKKRRRRSINSVNNKKVKNIYKMQPNFRSIDTRN